MQLHFAVAFFAIWLIVCAHAQAWDTYKRFDGINERFDDTRSPLMEDGYDFPEKRGKICKKLLNYLSYSVRA